MFTQLLKPVLVLVALATIFLLFRSSEPSPHCVHVGDSLQVCVNSDMARTPQNQQPRFEHDQFDLSKASGIHLQAARNETIAFQLTVRRTGWSTEQNIQVNVSDLIAVDSSQPAAISSDKNIQLFEAWYHPIEKGGHRWGADSDVLPWPGMYPDLLLPEYATCDDRSKKIRSDFYAPKNIRFNSTIWADVYIPTNQSPGSYSGSVTVRSDTGSRVEIPLTLTVWNAKLPERPSIDAVGELYRTYGLEGAGKDRTTARWREMAHCYQQLAHQHRMIFIERFDDLDQINWSSYRAYADPILDGSLFSPENGYSGTGLNVPVHLWRTPWEQDFDIVLKEPVAEEALQDFERMARRWHKEVLQQSWNQTDYFAYVFDEIVGRTDESAEDDQTKNYLLMARNAVNDVQQALDKGTAGPMIDLIWTSHSNAVQWQGHPELDLSEVVRFWAPNAGAASTEFLAEQKKKGHRTWFYHDGHPAIGAHSVNSSGIEMRTWGVVTARYGLDGNFMWALNLGQDDAPFRQPNYLLGDDRYGNGVLVYPGNQLPKIDYPASPGPLPSMRLKAWRRGLQDAELVFLAKENGHTAKADLLLKELIPSALADALEAGHKKAQWSFDEADWIEFRLALLKLASKT
ncbi:MAG: glycoside hydrolase domain-containing protein [Pseudomonadales bacterium]